MTDREGASFAATPHAAPGQPPAPARRWRGALRWRDWRVSWGARAQVAALGALVAAGQAPLGFWWLALPALALLFARIAAEPAARRATILGWYGGAGHFAAALFWIVEPFFVDPARDGWMAPFALPLMAFGMALFWALAAGVAARLGRSPAARALALAVTLAGADALRSYVLTGFPWALFGHVWIGTPVAQLAAWAGPLGLSALTLLAACLPAALCRGAGPRAVLPGAVLGLVLLAAAWGAGAWRLAAPLPDTADPAAGRIIRVVQPNAVQALKWDPQMQQVFFDRLIEDTAAPARAGGPRPDLVVWPETAVPWLLNDSGDLLQVIAGAGQGSPVALGIQRSVGSRYYNSLAVVSPEGELAALYDKHHLVPFGEYIPFGDQLARFGIHAFAAQEGMGYSPGAGAAVMHLGWLGRGLGDVLPLICYEAVFPQDLAAAPSRADWIVQVTNDAWFGSLSGPFQHLAQARLRAIEQGMPLIRAANTGVSAAVDPKGRVLASLPLDTDGWFDVALPRALPPTLYARTGDAPMLWLIGLALLGLIAARLRPARRPA